MLPMPCATARNSLPAFLLLFLMLLAGCGQGNFSGLTASGSSAPADLTGNWQFLFIGTGSAGLRGNIVQSGSTLNAALRLSYLPSLGACGSQDQVLGLVGSVAGGVATLTSAPFSGSVLRLQFSLASLAGGAYTGTLNISGSGCVLAQEALFGELIPPLNGSYSGTLAPSTLNTTAATGLGTATVTLMQSSTPNLDGSFPLTGSLAFTASGCTATTAFAGTISGTAVSLLSNTAVLGVPTASVLGNDFPQSSQINPVAVAFVSGPCSLSVTIPTAYTGTLQH